MTRYHDILKRLIPVLLGMYLFIYVFSVPMLMLDLVPPWGTWMGGFLNVLQGSIMGLWLVLNAGARGLIAAILITVLAGLIEHVGVTSGFPFGRYTYTDTLGLKLGGAVPLPIPFAWLLLIPAAIGTTRLVLGHAHSFHVLIIAPVLVLLYDLLLEPFATHIMDYWQWIDSGPYYGVPTSNFVAWWITALGLTLLTVIIGGRRMTHAVTLPVIPVLLYGLNVLLVTLVDLAYGYVLAGLLGIMLLLIGSWLLRDQGHALYVHLIQTARLMRRSDVSHESE